MHGPARLLHRACGVGTLRKLLNRLCSMHCRLVCRARMPLALLAFPVEDLSTALIKLACPAARTLLWRTCSVMLCTRSRMSFTVSLICLATAEFF